MDSNIIIPNLSFAVPTTDINDPKEKMWADDLFEVIKKYIQAFEATLDKEHEVGVMMTNFGQSVVMQVTSITYEDPVLMIFRGFVNGRESTLIQHIGQLNFMLTTVNRDPGQPKRKIGFLPEK